MDIITSYISIVVVALSAAIGSVGYILKNRHEQKRSARSVLYILLEIRHTILISFINVEEVTTYYINNMIKRFSNGDDSSDTLLSQFTVFRPLIQEHLFNVTKISLTRQEVLRDEYEVALNKLSKDNPILAYTLRGQDTIPNRINLEDKYLDKVLSKLDNEASGGDVNQFFSHLSDSLRIDNKKETIESINTLVRSLAKKCSFFDLIKVNKILKHNLDYDSIITDNSLDLIAEMVNESIEATVKLEKKL